MQTTLKTVFVVRQTQDQRIEHVAFVMAERRTATRRLTDVMVAIGAADTMAELVAKLAARNYPTTQARA